MSHRNVLHRWILAPYQQDRSVAREDGISYYIDCHRHHCGPYTGAGELMRTMVPDAYCRRPDLVMAQAIAILSVAPEMMSIIPMSDELTKIFTPEDGIFHSQRRTLRLAHGLVDFLLAYLSKESLYPCSIFFENVHMADPLDQEFIAILLRRADPELLSLTIGTMSDSLSELLLSALKIYAEIIQLQPMSMSERRKELSVLGLPNIWENWLLLHTSGWRGEWAPWRQLIQELDFRALEPDVSSLDDCLCALVREMSPEAHFILAQAYIEANCTSDDLLARTAYSLLDATLRQQLHENNAALLEKSLLEKLAPWSLSLGAIPYHREHSGRGVEALISACNYCTKIGYHEATLDLGYRGRTLANLEQSVEQYWFFTKEMIKSLLLLNRLTEAENLCKETQTQTDDAFTLMHCAYFMAILYVRLYREEQRDYSLARKWIQEAVTLAESIPDADNKTFDIIFLANNTLALVEMRLGHHHEAIRLLSEGLKDLQEKLPERYKNGEESETLLQNRARVYTALGQLERALEDYHILIRQAPHISEFYFERGNLYRRLKRYREALDDYNHAIIWSPPYPEVYYNRAGLLFASGRPEEAIADYSYVLDLDPTFIDARLNRASLFYEYENYTAAHEDVEYGLRLDPNNAQLLCILGLLNTVEQRPEEAYRAFSAALECDPSLLAAWTNRAIVSFGENKIEAAIADFTQALSIQEDVTVRYNRGLAYQSQQRWQEAIDDYTHALSLPHEDRQDILSQRDLCYEQLATVEQELVH